MGVLFNSKMNKLVWLDINLSSKNTFFVDVDLFNVDNEEIKEKLHPLATMGAATIPTTRVVTKTLTTQTNNADISKVTDDEFDDEDDDGDYIFYIIKNININRKKKQLNN